MTFVRAARSIRASATLRVALALAFLVTTCFGRAHILHAPAAPADTCGERCPLHVTSTSSDHDPAQCAICTTVASFGIDDASLTAVVVGTAETLGAPVHIFLLANEPIPGSASSRGPPTV